MAKNDGRPKTRGVPSQAGTPRLAVNPDNYLKLNPVWRLGLFDWDGPWGLRACEESNYRKHIEEHLKHFESMTWDEIQKASGGKGLGKGNNSHHVEVDKLSKDAQKRLRAAGVNTDTVFSLRCENCVRIYGVRQGACLSILWLDPYHAMGDGRAAYAWK
jgi:hypothetical protein